MAKENRTINSPTDLRPESFRTVHQRYRDLRRSMKTRDDRRRLYRVRSMMYGAIKTDSGRTRLNRVSILVALVAVAAAVSAVYMACSVGFSPYIPSVGYADNALDYIGLVIGKNLDSFLKWVPFAKPITVLFAAAMVLLMGIRVFVWLSDLHTAKRFTMRIYLEEMPMSDIVFLKDAMISGSIAEAENEYLLRYYGVDN